MDEKEAEARPVMGTIFLVILARTTTRKMVPHNWASEASPTLGCSIEISRDIYMSVCRMSYVVCPFYVKLTA